MSHHKKIILFFLAVTGIFVSCKKESTSQDELAKLPPATQTGANTFGCLVNGKAFMPKGSTGIGKPNYRVMVDPTYHNGQFSIDCYEVINATETQYLDFGSDSINGTGNYPLEIGGRLRIAWSSSNCRTSVYDTTSFRGGYLKITL